MLILLLILIFFIFLAYLMIKRYIIDDDTITLFTGSNGSGKTFFSVKHSLKCLTKLNFKVFFHNFFEHLKFWNVHKDIWEKPRFFSSIPVKYGLLKRKFSEPLKINHLVGVERLPHRCVVFIDEVNLICSQMQYKLKCEDALNTWVTLFRHFTHGGYLVLCTQNYNKVHWIFRYCVGYVHNLSGCHKIPKLFIWTKSKRVNVGDDVRQIVEIDGNENIKYLWSFIPLFKNYDAYCFDNVNNYQLLQESNIDYFETYKIEKWEKLK